MPRVDLFTREGRSFDQIIDVVFEQILGEGPSSLQPVGRRRRPFTSLVRFLLPNSTDFRCSLPIRIVICCRRRREIGFDVDVDGLSGFRRRIPSTKYIQTEKIK